MSNQQISRARPEITARRANTAQKTACATAYFLLVLRALAESAPTPEQGAVWYAPGAPLVLVGSDAREATIDKGGRVALRARALDLRRHTGSPLAAWLLGGAGTPVQGEMSAGVAWGEPAPGALGLRLAWLAQTGTGDLASAGGATITLHTPTQADSLVRARPLGDERVGRALVTGAAQAVRIELNLDLRAPDSPDARAMDAIVRLASQLPTDRWRAQAWAEVSGRSLPELDAPDAPAREGLQAWSQASASLVYAGLGRIASADAPLAAAVARRLVLLARVPIDDEATVLAPAWAPQPADVLQSVLAPGAGAREVYLGAQAWQARQPQLLVWAIEHAGAREGVGLSHRGALGVLSLEPKGLAGATVTGVTIEPAAIRALQGASLTAKLTGEGARSVGVRVADHQAACALQAGRAGAQPPGAPLPPLQADWTLADTLGGRARELDSVGALLTQVPGTRGGAPRWALVVQVERRDAGAAIDELRIWLGRAGAGERCVVVTPKGGAVDARTRAQVPSLVHEDAARWTLTLLLDDRDVARDEAHVAIQARSVQNGVRWSTPLAQMPWQTRPAPWAMDLSAWDQGLTTPRRTVVP